MQKILLTLWKGLTSLRLTVILLCFSMALVFFGTLDQVKTGIWMTQKLYFKSFFVFWHYPPEWPGGEHFSHLGIPMPGGYLVGILLLLNLTAAHIQRFQWTLKKVGIQLIHSGLILLLFSELMTGIIAEESMMSIDEGGKSNSSSSVLYNEVAFKTEAEDGRLHVISIPTAHMRSGDVYQHPSLPFDVYIVRFFKNASIGFVENNPGMEPAVATRGLGAPTGMPRDIGIREIPPTYAMNTVNTEAAYIQLIDKETNEDLGTWLISNVFESNFAPQTLQYGGREWTLNLRFTNKYFPFALELVEFRFDRYPGTEIPKNFSSEVIIHDPANNVDRRALIYMNHPLRYGGFTFYQASYDEATETTTVLQVVKNPGWLLPYISVLMMGFGMLWQFSYHLFHFLGKRSKQAAA